MNGFTAFARKEALEILRTWRIWVLPGILLFFALTGPVMARFTPEIVGALAGDQLGGLKLPDATYLDAYGQWTKNLTQLAIFALIIIYGGIVSGERKSGTAILVLTKPVSRSAFVIAKALVHSMFLTLIVVVGTALTWGVTVLVFGTAPAAPLWSAAMAWLVFGVLFVAIMTLLSVMMSSQAGAAGVGLGVFTVVSLAALWKPLGTYSPAALAGAPMTLAAGKESAILWPVVTALMLAVALVACAAALFRTKEL